MVNDAGTAGADQFVQRAALLADLGRYDDAVTELGYASALRPADPAVLTLLARIQLAARRPEPALVAADAALAAAPHSGDALVLRGLALLDLLRFPEASQVADRLLEAGPTDAHAQRNAAAILSESRNGQRALDAAWRGVQLAPNEPQTHLVLALVAARLQLFDLAERAYREGLELDPELADAGRDVGVVMLERRRYAEALEQLVDAVEIRPARPARTAGPAEPAAPAPVEGPPQVVDALRRRLSIAAVTLMVGAVVVACLAVPAAVGSRVLAVGLPAVLLFTLRSFVRRLPGPPRTVLPELFEALPPLRVALWAIAASGGLLVLYGLLGAVWPVAGAVVAAAAAEFAVLRTYR